MCSFTMSDTISKDNCNNSTTATTPQPTPERRLYKPVVIVHGLMSGDVSTMEHLAGRIEDVRTEIMCTKILYHNLIMVKNQ